jgi:hypothetical protein
LSGSWARAAHAATRHGKSQSSAGAERLDRASSCEHLQRAARRSDCRRSGISSRPAERRRPAISASASWHLTRGDDVSQHARQCETEPDETPDQLAKIVHRGDRSSVMELPRGMGRKAQFRPSQIPGPFPPSPGYSTLGGTPQSVAIPQRAVAEEGSGETSLSRRPDFAPRRCRARAPRRQSLGRSALMTRG